MSNTPTPPKPNPHVPEALPPDVRYGFTNYGIKQMIHHCHWIPVGRGFTAAFMDRHWPGLSLSDGMDAAKSAGALKRDDKHFTGLAVRKDVKELHILHDGTLRLVKYTRAELQALDQ